MNGRVSHLWQSTLLPIRAPGMAHLLRRETSGEGVAPALLANVLSLAVGRSVVDETGLTGRYDFALRCAASPAGGASAGESNGPSIFTGPQEQVGLRLESPKVTTESIEIVSADRPKEN